MRYRADITAGPLKVPESRIIADLLLQGTDEMGWREALYDQNILLGDFLINHSHDPDVSGQIGIWVSGFFGSGKSHFIKVLSYLLQNHPHTHDGQSKQAIEFFETKIKDAMLFGDIQRAVASNTTVILFNIDSKANTKSGRDAILSVFLKVLNEMQGYCPDHPHSNKGGPFRKWFGNNQYVVNWQHDGREMRACVPNCASPWATQDLPSQ